MFIKSSIDYLHQPGLVAHALLFMFTSMPPCASLLIASLALAAAPTWAQTLQPAPHHPSTSLGFTAGYGAPYSWGADLSVLVRPPLDVMAGVGSNLVTGVKMGLGGRYYFAPTRVVSPFAGPNLVYSTGLNRVMVQPGNRYSVGGSTYGLPAVAEVNFKPACLLHLRGGWRWQAADNFALLGTLGYGFVLNDNVVEYVYVTRNPPSALLNAVNFISPGGLEISGSIAFRLGRR